MKYLLGLFSLLLSYSFAFGQLQFIDVEPHTLSAPNSEQPEGTTTYRVYANLLSPEDRVSAVFGGGCKPIDISTTTTFFNEENGGVTPASINVASFDLFPNLEADSWVTIGPDDAADAGADGIGALSAEGAPFSDAFQTNPGSNLDLPSGSWFSPDPISSAGTGDENRVLIGQFTTDGELSFHLNVSVFVGGDQQNGRIDYVWNLDCEESPFEADGSALGLIFNGQYCGDPAACNYSEFAEPEDFNNTLCNYDACSGCTNPDFCNYSEYYISDDGSCTNECGGCMDEEALNFDPNANVDDGSCLYLGCTNALAINFQDNAGQDDGSCEFEGCTDPEALNYFLLATEDDGTCTYICASNEIVFNMNSTLGIGWFNGYYIVTDDEGDFVASGSLELADETDEANFGIDLVCLPPGDYQVTLFEVIEGGVMTLEIGCAEEGNILIESPNVATAFTIDDEVDCALGCTDETASNFDELANFDFGCVFLGCTDELATNYDPIANEDDGSCIIGITGYVFFDAEMTGMFNEELDHRMPNYSLQVQPSNQSIFTNQEGYFELVDLPDGVYTISVQPSIDYPVLTTSESYTVEVNGNGIPPLIFGLSSTETNDALQINLLSLTDGVPCNGDKQAILFSVENTGATVLSGEVVLSFDDLYQGVDSYSQIPLLEEANSLTFDFSTLAPGSSQGFAVTLLAPLAENTGEAITNSIVASAFQGEELLVTSEKLIEDEVSCEYSTNDKGAEPLGYAEPHFILHETEIEYRIRFQNTGTEQVENVLIRDTLDTRLDLNTFELVAQSHPVVAALDWTTRELTLLFEHIQLPDSSTEQLASHGAVSYRIKPLAEAEQGSVVNNTAHIFLDEAPAIATNNVFHTLYECGAEADFSVNSEVCLGDPISAESTTPYVTFWSWSADGAFLSDEAAITVETTVSGTVVLELTAGNDLCERTSTEEITVFSLPNPEISQEGSELIATDGASWQWYLNGEAIEGANEMTYTISVAGTYTVDVIDENGCFGTSFEFLAAPVNVNETEELSMTFYPNPFSSLGTLQLSKTDQWDIVLLDATGRVVRAERFAGNNWTLERRDLAPGVYFLQAQGRGELAVIEIIVR